MMIEQIEQSQEVFGMNADMDVKIIKEAYKEIAKELPKWR